MIDPDEIQLNHLNENQEIKLAHALGLDQCGFLWYSKSLQSRGGRLNDVGAEVFKNGICVKCCRKFVNEDCNSNASKYKLW